MALPVMAEFVGGCWKARVGIQLQALDWDIFAPTNTITGYTIGLEKLSAYGYFFVGAEMAVSL